MTTRTNFFSGMQVSAHDMTHSQIALAGAITNRTIDFFTYGVIDGLTTLVDSATNNHIAVTLGTAIDPIGERIDVLAAIRSLGYGGAALNAAAGTYTVVARYQAGNDGIMAIDPNGVSQVTHILDSYSVVALKTGTDTLQANDVRLVGATVASPGGSITLDTSTRDTATSRLSSALSALQVKTTSGGVTLAATDYFLIVNKSSADVTVVTLPAAPTTATAYIIKDGKGDAQLRPITLVPASGTIDGATNYILNVNYGAVGTVYNGTQYNLF